MISKPARSYPYGLIFFTLVLADVFALFMLLSFLVGISLLGQAVVLTANDAATDALFGGADYLGSVLFIDWPLLCVFQGVAIRRLGKKTLGFEMNRATAFLTALVIFLIPLVISYAFGLYSFESLGPFLAGLFAGAWFLKRCLEDPDSKMSDAERLSVPGKEIVDLGPDKEPALVSSDKDL